MPNLITSILVVAGADLILEELELETEDPETLEEALATIEANEITK
jgi:hypothetical protein